MNYINNRLKPGMIILTNKRGFIRTIELNNSFYLGCGVYFCGLVSEKNKKKEKNVG